MVIENFKLALTIIVGVVFGAWFGFEAIRRTLIFREAASWKSVQGQILASHAFPSSKVSGALELNVRYEYVVAGRNLVACTPRLSGNAINLRKPVTITQ